MPTERGQPTSTPGSATMVTHYVNSTADDPADTTTGYFNNGTLRQGFNNLSVNGGGYITFADTLGTSPSFSSTASIALASGLTYELDTNAGYNPVIADVLTGSGALRKGGGDGGGVALTGANTYTGATTVSSGTLTLAGNGRIGDSAITVNAGATLAVTGAAGSMSTTADLTLTGTSSYPALATLAGTGTFSRNYVNIGLDGYGALTQTGAALAVKQSLYVGINTGSGGTYTISGGVASIANFLDVGRFNSVGAVNQTGGDVTAGAVSLRTGSTGTATYILSGGTLSAQSLEVSSQPGRATFTQNGGAVSLVAGGIGYGTLYLGSGVGGGAYNLSAGSLTAVNSYIGSASSGANASSVFTQTGGTHTTGLLAITAGYTASERGEYMLGNGAGSGAVLAVGRIISGNNGYPGTSILHFNGGLLKATGPSTVFILRLTTADVQAGGARIDSNGFDITVPQVLTTGVSGGSDGGLTKLGAGTLTLSGANTYSGHTTVSAGTLNVSGSLVSAIDVGAGGTLTGGGATSTEVTVMAGGTFAPGSGTTPFTTLRLVMAGTFAETISSATVFNQVKVTPSALAVSLSGALSLNYTGGASGFSVGTVLKIIDNAGAQAIAGTFSNAAEGAILGSGGHGFRVSYVGGDGNDVTLTELAGLYGTEANDYLVGTSGADNIYGLAGADVLIGGAGADTMYGGLGDDAYEVTETGDVVIENAGEGTDTAYSYLADYTLPANVERLELEGSAGTGRGNALANTIIGTSGSNLLVGGAGADTLIGGAGNDAYEVADAGDVVVELANGGYDTVYSYLPDYTLPANVDRLELAGGARIGRGNALDNYMIGTGGNDTLIGGGGADIMYGGSGDDAYEVTEAGDQVFESTGQGYDTVYSYLNDYTLTYAVERLELEGSARIGRGNVFDNVIVGTPGANVLIGGAGSDTLIGGAGDDAYEVTEAGDGVVESPGEGIDTVYSYLNSYTLPANVERLELAGSAVVGAGNALNNTIIGTGGANYLNGGTGDDTLTGGGGVDIFYWLGPSAGRDVITDFAAAAGEVVNVASAQFASYAAIQVAMSQVGGDVVITLDAATTLTLQNVLIGQLSSANFAFYAGPY